MHLWSLINHYLSKLMQKESKTKLMHLCLVYFLHQNTSFYIHINVLFFKEFRNKKYFISMWYDYQKKKNIWIQLMRRYLVSNDNMSMVSKSNQYETCQQKITNPLTIKRHVLVGSYFCTHVSRLLDFDRDDVVSFDTKYFFLYETLSSFNVNYQLPC